MSLLTVLKRALATIAVAALVGCGAPNDGTGPLKVGVISGPEADVMKVAIDIAKNEHGLDVEMIEFTDYISPNVALSDGSIDLNAYQHRPYLNSMVDNQGLKITAVANTFVYPIAAYSKKITDIKDLKDGAKIAVPNDPSNEGRALILLHDNGLITLKDRSNLEATPADIAENPRGFEFVELEAPQLPRSLEDVDLALINNTFAAPAGFTPKENGLIVEGVDSPYVNVMVARQGSENDPRIQTLIKAYQTAPVEAKAAEMFKNTAVRGWK